MKKLNDYKIDSESEMVYQIKSLFKIRILQPYGRFYHKWIWKGTKESKPFEDIEKFVEDNQLRKKYAYSILK